MRRASLSSLALALVLAACSDDGAGTDAGNDEPGPVRGELEITSIEVSQAIVQPIYLDGEVVNPATYTVPLVPNRHMWVRALWDPPLEWEPRKLTARLHLEYPDGEEEVIYDDRESEKGHPPVVQGKSSPTDILSGFYWRLDPEDVVPGMRYSVTVVETEVRNDIPETTGKTRWPRESNTALPVESSSGALRISIVGVHYDIPGCSTDTSMLSDDELEVLRSTFDSWSAIENDSVIIDTSLSVDITEPIDVLSLLDVVGPIRAQYPDLIDAFFLILLDNCGMDTGGIAGVAPVNSEPPVPGEAATRYAAGLWNPNDVHGSTTIALHEVGHAEGALHAPCGNPDGPDPYYPHPEADIGVRGLDPYTAQFYDPDTYKDYMSYCGPAWVSDYRFEKSYVTLTALTQWASASPPSPPTVSGFTGEVLTGVVQPDGETRWWINYNARPPEVRPDTPLRLGLHTRAGEFELGADVRLLPDVPGARLVTVPLVDELQIQHVEDILAIQVHGDLALSVAEPRVADRRNIEFRHTGFSWDLTAR